jgi:hypothetical protein
MRRCSMSVQHRNHRQRPVSAITCTTYPCRSHHRHETNVAVLCPSVRAKRWPGPEPEAEFMGPLQPPGHGKHEVWLILVCAHAHALNVAYASGAGLLLVLPAAR